MTEPNRNGAAAIRSLTVEISSRGLNATAVGCDFPTQDLADRFHVRLFAGDDVGAPFVDLRAAVERFLMEQALLGRWTPPEGDPQWEPYRQRVAAQENTA